MNKIKNINSNLLVLLLCILISLAAYSPAINAFFSSDDFAWIYQIKTKGAFHLWMAEPHLYFRPITSLTFFLDYKIWGLNPIGYHLTSLLFHSLCAFQLYITTALLLNQIQFPKNHVKTLSLLATFIFLILPIHGEAVCWISARSDLIVTFFCLTAFNLYLAYQKTHLKSYLISSYIVFFCALLSKETAIIYPGLVFLYKIYEHLSLRKNDHLSLINYWLKIAYFPTLYATVFPLYFLIRYIRIRRFIGGQGASVHLDFDGGIIFQGLGRSLRTILPPIPESSEQLWQILFTLFAGGIVGCCVLLWKKGGLDKKLAQLILLFIAFFLLSLLPMLNLWLSVTTYENERLLYFPSVFVSILISLLLGNIYFNFQLIFFILLTALTIFWSINLNSSAFRWQTVGQVSRQVLEDIKAANIEVDHTIFLNLPDNLKGSYIYMSSFDEAIQLFDETQQNKRPYVLLFQNLTHPQNTTKILKYGQNQYYVQLKDEKTSFLNRYRFPLEKEFETIHYKVKNLDQDRYRTYDLELISPVFQHLAYYSDEKLVIQKIPPQNSPIKRITNPRVLEHELGFINRPIVNLEQNNNSLFISGNIANSQNSITPLIVTENAEIHLDNGIISIPTSLNEQQNWSIFLSYGEQRLIFTQGKVDSEENQNLSKNPNVKTFKWKADFPAKLLPLFGRTEIQAWLFVPEKKQFFPLSGTVPIRVIPNQIDPDADWVKNPSEVHGFFDKNYQTSSQFLIQNNQPTRITLEGWCRLPKQEQQPDQVFLSLNDEPSFFATAHINLPSPTVAETFNSDLYHNRRWSITFSTAFLPLETNRISAWVYDPSKNGFFKLEDDLNLRVFPENLTFNREPKQVYGYVDSPQPTEEPLQVNGSENITIEGWGILPNSPQQPEQVYLSYGDQPIFLTQAEINLESQDVAQAFNSEKYSHSRWKAEFSTILLPPGENTVNAWIYNPEQQQLVKLKQELKVIRL